MSLLSVLRKPWLNRAANNKVELRDGSLNVNDKNHWIIQLTEGSNSSGVIITEETALSITAVFACVRVLAETIASLPCIIYERNGEQREIRRDHFLFPILHDTGPAPWLTAFDFWETIIGHLALRGNAYCFIVRQQNGKINGLFPLNPKNMDIKVNIEDFRNPEIIYVYKPEGSKEIPIEAKDIWHLKGLGIDGFTGLSPITQHRDAMGLAVNAESHGNKFFKNGVLPSGVAAHPGRLSDEAYKRLKESIQTTAGGANTFKTLLLEEGTTWNQLSLSMEDAQFLESRSFQVEEIARIFRVPTILIGHPDKASTYASAEQFMLSFVMHTLRPWLVNLEKSILKYLIPEREQQKIFAEFKVEGLLRGDIKTRYESYAIAVQNKILNTNEVRKLENLPPRPGGEVYENPNISTNKGGENVDGEENQND